MPPRSDTHGKVDPIFSRGKYQTENENKNRISNTTKPLVFFIIVRLQAGSSMCVSCRKIELIQSRSSQKGRKGNYKGREGKGKNRYNNYHKGKSKGYKGY